MSIETPVLFLPGTLCDERLWMPVWQHLDCHQRSYVPLQWADTFEQMMMLTADRVTAFTQPAHLVGFSMGGFIATQFALAHPESVASLTLIGYASCGLSKTELSHRQQLIKTINSGKYKGSNTNRNKQFLHPEHPQKSELLAVINAMGDDLGGQVLKAHIQATTPRPSLTQALSNLTIPVNIIASKTDAVVPFSDIQEMHQGCQQSQLSTIDNAGHMMPLEQPQQVAEILSRLLQ